DKLMRIGTANFKGAMLVFKRWFRGASIKDIKFDHSPIWIRVEGIPLHLNQIQVAIIVLDKLGATSSIDQSTLSSTTPSVIRVRVLLNIKLPLVPGFYLEFGNNKFVWVDLRYEGVFNFCKHYGKFGHHNRTTGVNLLLQPYDFQPLDTSTSSNIPTNNLGEGSQVNHVQEEDDDTSEDREEDNDENEDTEDD
ncbi:hypothetical protein RDABS01_016535, partial [Bienertia sinuspersici]